MPPGPPPGGPASTHEPGVTLSEGFLLPIVAIWALSFLCYAAAGLLMWRRRIPRNAHILLTVVGFVADIGGLTLQKIHLMQVGRGMLSIPPALRTAQGATLDTSIALYCVVAVLGFARVVGWHRVGRWHVPAALLFVGVWLLARYFAWQVMR